MKVKFEEWVGLLYTKTRKLNSFKIHIWCKKLNSGLEMLIGFIILYCMKITKLGKDFPRDWILVIVRDLLGWALKQLMHTMVLAKP